MTNMGRKTLSVAETKATFSRRIREVEAGESIVVTRRGRPVVALVRAEYLDAIERLRAAGPQRGLASVAGGWAESEELAAILESSTRAGGRPVSAIG